MLRDSPDSTFCVLYRSTCGVVCCVVAEAVYEVVQNLARALIIQATTPARLHTTQFPPPHQHPRPVATPTFTSRTPEALLVAGRDCEALRTVSDAPSSSVMHTPSRSCGCCSALRARCNSYNQYRIALGALRVSKDASAAIAPRPVHAMCTNPGDAMLRQHWRFSAPSIAVLASVGIFMYLNAGGSRCNGGRRSLVRGRCHQNYHTHHFSPNQSRVVTAVLIERHANECI